ncbi:MAG: hypothetical protein EBY43_07310 [Opitutae bacterium]|nr:hypothetical protein [Opitutae bacterium]
MKSFNQWALICFFSFGHSLFALEEPPENSAPAFFHTIIFEGGGSEDLTYAPWGNAEDVNATLYNIRVGSFRMTKKFCYYGSSPVRFLNQDRELVFEHEFSRNGSEGFEQIILIRRLRDGKLTSHGIPFDESLVPMGSFLLQSFANESTFFKAGETKMSIQSGKSRLFHSGQNTQDLSVKGYLMRNGKYKEALTQNISKPQSKRGIIAVRVSGDLIRSTSLITGSIQKSFVLGFNSPKTINSAPNLPENRSEPVQGGLD